VTQLIANYFRNKPVYFLRQDGSAEEIATRWLLSRYALNPVACSPYSRYHECQPKAKMRAKLR